MKRVGIDTGGTFTDLVLFDEESAAITVAKRPSTPAAPEEAIFDAVQQAGMDLAAIGQVVIGTTIATNALLERKGARVLYITTAGFEDVLFIQRINRKYLYDLQWQKPDPLARRRDSLGVVERIDKAGQIIIPLTDEALDRLGEALAARLQEDPARPCAAAVNLLFSYTNPGHELRIGAYLAERFPALPVSLSHAISPTWREYERGTSVTADAYIKPLVDRFVAGVAAGLQERGLRSDLFFMKSNGGQVAVEAASARPLDLMLSGLAGGIIAGLHFGRLAGLDHLITLDMGGTSADVGVVTGGDISYTTEYELEFGMPVSTPCIDLKTIGAGGSSIASVDRGGRLKVGPESAAADPGPACYGKGGTRPTVTDANVVLGRLDPGYFLGGAMSLSADLAHQAVAGLASQLGMDVLETAHAIVELTNENMANAIRMLTVERGVDHRAYALVAFGGAGPLHAAALAATLEIGRIVVPPYPGLTSAFGTLLADPRVDVRWTLAVRSDQVDAGWLDARFNELTNQALAELRREGFRGGEPTVARSISMRYAGQNYEQDVPVPPGPMSAERLREVCAAFHAQHVRFYGYSMPSGTIELVHCNVSALGTTSPPQTPPVPEGPPPAPAAQRPIYFKGPGWLDCPIYRRAALQLGNVLAGPLLVEEEDSTILVEPGGRLLVDARGLLLIEVPVARPARTSL